MVETEIRGTLPIIPQSFAKALALVAALMEKSIQTTILVGGRPEAWPALKSGRETPLVASGALFRSIQSRSGDTWAEAGVISGPIYAGVHQYGATLHPTVTERSKAFFWAMWYETGDVKWKYMALMPVGSLMNVVVPQREYVKLLEEDVEKIIELLGNEITISRGEEIMFKN